MKLKLLKLRSAVVLNDPQKKAIRGGSGTACTGMPFEQCGGECYSGGVIGGINSYPGYCEWVERSHCACAFITIG